MKVSDFMCLFEARVDYLRGWYYQRLQAKALRDGVPDYDPSGDHPHNDEYFDAVASADPSVNNAYTQWMLNLGMNGKLKTEDLYKATQYLQIFDQHKRQLPIRDINQYKSLPDLFKAIENLVPEQSNRQVDQAEREKIRQDVNIVYSGPEGKILVPKTEAASCYLGRGTQWCTAATESGNYFDEYNRLGPLYVILPNDKRKYQFSLPGDQLMDERDEYVNLQDFNYNYPWVRQNLRFTPEEVDKVSTAEALRDIRWDHDDEERLTAYPSVNFMLAQEPATRLVFLKHFPGFFLALSRYGEPPASPEERLLACELSPDNLIWIRDPTREERLATIQANPYWIRQMRRNYDITEEEKLLAVTLDGETVQYIENPSPEVRLAALKSSPKAVQYIGVDSPEERAVLIHQNGPQSLNYDKYVPQQHIGDLTPEEHAHTENSHQESLRFRNEHARQQYRLQQAEWARQEQAQRENDMR